MKTSWNSTRRSRPASASTTPRWSVVVKVEREVSNDVLVEFLERLTSKIRDGFFVHVAERAEDRGPRASPFLVVDHGMKSRLDD